MSALTEITRVRHAARRGWCILAALGTMASAPALAHAAPAREAGFRIGAPGTGRLGLAAPTIATAASPGTVVPGQSFSDTAVVNGLVSPTASTVTFRLFGPGDPTCSGPPVLQSVVALPPGAPVQSTPFTPTQPGTYRWIASYNGDANNPPASGLCNAPNENVVVLPSAPTKSDAIAPDTFIDDGPRGTTRDPTATFEFSSSEVGGTFACGLDGGALDSCSSPLTTAELQPGAHTFAVRARDASGNVDGTPATAAFDVQPTTPSGHGPSTGCHVSDGAFTRCGDGSDEWSDIQPRAFEDSGAFLYADQADLVADRGIPGSPVDTFMLAYDECARRTALGPDEFFVVSFDTVEAEDGEPERLERYTVHVFADATIMFFENGELQHVDGGATRVAEIEGQRGDAGFGPSPDCPFKHVVVEYEIELAAAGGHSYSPDPLFWGGTPPNRAPIAGDDGARLTGSSVGVAVLANDVDPDGALDPALVAVASGPARGSVSVSGGTATYTPGASFDDTDSFTYTVADDEGEVSNAATVEITGCPSGRAYPVTLPHVDAPVNLFKPVSFSFAELALTFTTQATTGSAYCSATSNAGSLGIFMTCKLVAPCALASGIPVRIATTDTSATLDFFRREDVGAIPACDFDHATGVRNGCLLGPASSGPYARWSTPGFDIDFLPPILAAHRNTGPLTFWVAVSALNAAGSGLGPKIQAIESFLHRALITRLASIDRAAIVLDPPAEVLVTDAHGRRTGRLPAGAVVQEIPASGYFATDSASMVLILQQEQGSYATQLTGVPGSPFSLSMANVDLYRDPQSPAVAEQHVDGTLDAGGSYSDDFDVAARESPSALRPGFDATALPASDDGSSDPVALGFDVDLGARTFHEAFVNNNGNLTFDSPLATYTPFELATARQPIIAPFFADVDTRSGSVARYGQSTVDGRPAFGATWPGVRCFAAATSPTNAFQVVLVDRSDVSPGAFDVELNYDRIGWDAGQASGGGDDCRGGGVAPLGIAAVAAGRIAARAGFSDGTGDPGATVELAGSGVPDALLDAQASGLIHGARDSTLPGRHVFEVRPPARDGDGDGVRDDADNCPQTANADQADSSLVGIGDACHSEALRHSTSGFLQAGLDASTAARPRGRSTLADEPGMLERLVRIVRFRVSAGLTSSAQTLTANLVDSVVDIGLVDAADAPQLESDVVEEVLGPQPPPPPVPPAPPPPPPPVPPPPPPVPPPPPAPKDTTAPVVSKLRATPSVVRVARAAGLRRPAATTVRYSLSEAARVRIVLERVRDGRRSGATCKAPSRALARAPRCTRYVALTQLSQRAVSGPNARRFAGRVGHWPLPPGRYRFAVTATDQAGNRSKQRTTGLRVLAR